MGAFSNLIEDIEESDPLSDPKAYAASLPSSVDRPTGRYISVPSAVTGKPLNYFVPDALASLLTRSRPEIAPQKLVRNDLFAGLAFARCAATYGRYSSVDDAQAVRFCRLMTESTEQLRSVVDLTDLGKSILAGTEGLRTGMVFSGAHSASAARHVYAPHAAVPDLMDALSEGITSYLDGVEPSVAMSITHYFAVHVHPFEDANGRWARLVASAVGIQMAPSLRVMVNSTFHNLFKGELAEFVWPRCAISGMRNYLELVLTFESECIKKMAGSGILALVKRFNNEVLATKKNHCDARRVLSIIYGRGSIDLSSFRSALGISSRVLDGAMERISSATQASLICRDRIDMAPVLDSVKGLIDQAKENALSRVVR